MAAYECEVCGMSVDLSCAKCGAELVDEVLSKADGTSVRVSKCPNGHGMIKSPQCCATDMTCQL